MTIGVWWERVEVKGLAEVVKAHRCESGDDDIVVREISVKWAAEREVFRVVRERVIDRRVAAGDVLVCEASQQLLDVTHALCAAGRLSYRQGLVVE